METLKKIFLREGEIYCNKNPALVSTVLGSCVSVCIFDKKQKCGGINHYSLPASSVDEECQTPNKYAEYAISNLLKSIKNDLGSEKEDLIVKILGGSSGHSDAVGSSNIKAAIEILAQFGLEIQSKSVGGQLGRKIEFNTYTGEVSLKFIEQKVVQTKSDPRIKVLIVDDSRPVRMLLKKIIEESSDFVVVGQAADPYEAIEIRKNQEVDVITLDINMPKMDGVTYLKQYMSSAPVPTIIVTDYNLNSSSPVFEALEHGAFDYIKKPSFGDAEERTLEIHEKIKAAFKCQTGQSYWKKSLESVGKGIPFNISSNDINKFLIVLGSSTGGTEVIKDILRRLPENIPPILIVQHIPPVFSRAFADRLNELCPFHVQEARDRDIVQSGHVYVAPGAKQMKIVSDKAQIKVEITDDSPVNRFKPSVDYLFNSAARIRGRKIISIILTGMGADGAKGMVELKKIGSETIVQNEQSCVVFGMPKAAIELEAAKHILSPKDIVGKMYEIINKSGKSFRRNG